MAVAGLVGSVVVSQLAVAAIDESSVEAGSPALQAQPADEAPTDTTAATQVESPEITGGRELGSVDTPSSTAPSSEANIDCPPLFGLLFPFGRAEPLTDLGSRPDELASWMAGHGDAELLLNGHADSAGSEQANLGLSFRRAEAAADILVKAGVAPDRIQPRGFGEYQPVVGVAPDSERNRRVTMEIPGLDDCPPSDDKDITE